MAMNDLRKRLLRDIAELQTNPYPNIQIHVRDQNLAGVCLVLSPEGWQTLHLTVRFHEDYPLHAPTVSMDSDVRHPNVFNHYICASILNTAEGYTPAYTLKGIAIQLLSFFGSDSIEQDYGGRVSLKSYRDASGSHRSYFCSQCRFTDGPSSSPRVSLADFITDPEFHTSPVDLPVLRAPVPEGPRHCVLDSLPNEVLLQVVENLDFEDLTKFARAWGRVSRLITQFDVVRTRELQCFVFKENYLTQKLGVGVAVVGNGRQRTLQSEFDLVSGLAHSRHGIHTSIHGIPFDHWLPLPLSYGHWERVKASAHESLVRIAQDARIGSTTLAVYAFMNDIMVRLNSDLERRRETRDVHAQRSTLRHASEKAIESYFHLFHLLLCMATANLKIVAEANQMISSFLAGRTAKADVPNLGYLLIALLISDVDPTEALMKKIVTEAITRNVVWLLDRKGAGMAELGYLEADPVSQYRLKRTFEGSRTSYRLLMFSELFRRTARPSPRSSTTSPSLVEAVVKPQVHSYSTAATQTPVASKVTTPAQPQSSSQGGKKTLPQLCDELFRRHGGAPPGAAAHLAREVRRLQQIDDFPSFLREMGITIPSAANFCSVLRETVTASAEKGYSRPTGAYRRSLASLRLARDPTIDRVAVEADLKGRGMVLPPASRVQFDVENGIIKFFPGTGGGDHEGAKGGPNGRGRGRGRGRGF